MTASPPHFRAGTADATVCMGCGYGLGLHRTIIDGQTYHPSCAPILDKAIAWDAVAAKNVQIAALQARVEELTKALAPFVAVAKVMDFYTQESMPGMTYPRPECESRYSDEPRCVTLTAADFSRVLALALED